MFLISGHYAFTMNKEKTAQLIKELLVEIGEDPERKGLCLTPERVANSLEFLTSGYKSDLKALINDAVFESDANNMILCRNIEIYSLCEHHMLPFFGSCSIGYVAKDHVIGISKLARIVNHFSRRLQIQERLTAQIAGAVMDAVDAVGVGVLIRARHMCMTMRGVEKQHSVMTTSSLLGNFKTNAATRSEFLNLSGEA